MDPKRFKDRQRAWRLAHPERLKAARAAWYVANSERHKAYSRAWYAANSERAKAVVSSYQRAHPERVKAWKSAWSRAHPEEVVQYALNYRARRRGAPGRHSLQEWKEKCELLGNVCFYCGEAGPLERDHNVPLTRGGSDSIDNILPACRPCNAKKRTKTAREYLGLVA